MTGFGDVSLPDVRTQQVVAATAVAGLFGVWYWVRRLRSVPAPIIPDSLQSGTPSDEITLIGGLEFLRVQPYEINCRSLLPDTCCIF